VVLGDLVLGGLGFEADLGVASDWFMFADELARGELVLDELVLGRVRRPR
jgi:hypothetical protein